MKRILRKVDDMKKETCFVPTFGEHIDDFVTELVDEKVKSKTPFYGVFNDKLIIVNSRSTKDELIVNYWK